MRVLHIITGLGAGGAEHQLLALTSRTATETSVVSLARGGSVAEELAKRGIPVTSLAMRGNRDLAVIPRLREVIRRSHPDVIHTHLYRACVYGAVAAGLAGAGPVVSTEHSVGERQIEGRPKSPWVRSLYLAAQRRCHTTIAVSGAVRGRLVAWGVPPARVVVIPNAFEPDDFAFDPGARSRIREQLGLAPDCVVVGGIGRLEAVKRFHLLIAAMAPLLDHRHRLVLVGEGRQRLTLERQVVTAGVSDRVLFLGERRDVAPLLSAIDALVVPSAEETFGLTVLEGLASGLPVAHGACPALEELGRPVLGAWPVTGEVKALRTTVEALLDQAGSGRTEPSPLLRSWPADLVAARTDDVYQRAARRPTAASGAAPVRAPGIPARQGPASGLATARGGPASKQ
jgi:glycosyltransferase involved in cell wall biosynthesis